MEDPRGEPGSCVAYSPSGEHIVSGSEDAVRIWHARTGAQLHVFQPFGASDWEFAWSVSYSPDGRSVAVGSHNGDIYIWDIASGT